MHPCRNIFKRPFFAIKLFKKCDWSLSLYVVFGIDNSSTWAPLFFNKVPCQHIIPHTSQTDTFNFTACHLCQSHCFFSLVVHSSVSGIITVLYHSAQVNLHNYGYTPKLPYLTFAWFCSCVHFTCKHSLLFFLSSDSALIPCFCFSWFWSFWG